MEHLTKHATEEMDQDDHYDLFEKDVVSNCCFAPVINRGGCNPICSLCKEPCGEEKEEE